MDHVVIHAREIGSNVERTLTMDDDLLQVTIASIAANANVGIVDADDDRAGVDGLVHALQVIDVLHHEIHEGETFYISYKAPDGAPIADNGTVAFVLTTTTHECHAIYQGACGGDAEIEVQEWPTITGGTATTAYNRNRTSAAGTTVTIVRDPVVNAPGVLLDNQFIPGGTGGNAVGGTGGQRHEWVLAPSTIYLFRLTNRAGNAQPASLIVEWYEEA